MPETATWWFASPSSHFVREITVEFLVGYVLLPVDVKHYLQHLGVATIERVPAVSVHASQL